MAKIFGNRSFYVGTTRASHELRVYTNDKAMAASIVSGRQDKSSAVETMRQTIPEKGEVGRDPALNPGAPGRDVTRH